MNNWMTWLETGKHARSHGDSRMENGYRAKIITDRSAPDSVFGPAEDGGEAGGGRMSMKAEGIPERLVRGAHSCL